MVPLNYCISIGKRRSFRSTTINEPIWGFWNRNVCEVVKCSQGKNKEVRTGMGFEGIREGGEEESSWVERRAAIKFNGVLEKGRLKSLEAKESCNPWEDQICKVDKG